MKKIVLLFALLFPCLVFAITAYVSTDKAVYSRGEIVTASIAIDMSGQEALLGSYTCALTWDSRVLQFTGYTSGADGFKQLVNTANAGSGLIRFTGANPYGSDGSVNLLNLTFTVIGFPGSSSSINPQFSSMAAAYTFANLLPVNISPARVTVARSFPVFRFWPNPFNPVINLQVDLPNKDHVTLAIYDILGREVCRLADNPMAAGPHVLTWAGKDAQGRDVPTGAYFCRLTVGGETITNKVIYAK